MRQERRLEGLLRLSAKKHPGHIAVEDPERDVRVSYSELDRLADAVRDELVESGVGPGDRVGLCAPKSIGGVAAIFGILRAGAGYVPIDPSAPPVRSTGILVDCAVRATIADAGLRAGLGEGATGAPADLGGLRSLEAVAPPLRMLAGPGTPERQEGRDIAYVLYTSGSTGVPKGVVHSHASATSFVDWCSETFEPGSDDRFSSHAPFHFDLSILDLYLPIKHGATLVLFGELLGRAPQPLGRAISERRISVWYSTPSILRLLLEFGKLESLSFEALRLVLYAGEVFPTRHLAALRRLWPGPRFFNLYGPTETNVCTFHEVPATIPADRTESYPIGRACGNDRVRIVDGEGADVSPGDEGELVVSGSSVMDGYWNLPELTESAFLEDADGVRWYKTGDIVQRNADGDLDFLGRRDRMVKRRGYRVELGEIEAALYRHPDASEAAAIALADPERGVVIKVYLAWAVEPPPSLVEVKRFCAKNLPAYMIPDTFVYRDSLPRTSTDKIDYQGLSAEG